MDEFHFLRPLWLIGCGAAVLIAVLWNRHHAYGSHWENLIAPQLLKVLIEGQSRPFGRRLGLFIGIGLALACVGLAGPTWERLPQPVEQRNDAMVLILDLSLSMYVEDIAPSRLIRARQEITDVLRARTEGYTALVVYAGDAHAVTPLTDDIRTIENLLPALSPDMMPVLGSNVKNGLQKAHELFSNAHIDRGRILLVTDGVDRLSDVTDFADPRFPISILGVGTRRGGPIPLDFANQPGRRLQTEQGDLIQPTLDEDRLQSIADLAHGYYRTLAVGDADINAVMSTPLPGDDQTVEVERDFDTWSDSGYWITLALIPLLLLGFRRGTLAVIAICLVPLPADANLWDDLWARRDHQGIQQLRSGDPQRAAELFEDPDWEAVAYYHGGDFGVAAQGFAASSLPEARYNLGNALAKAGELRMAIDAYDQVLSSNPDHEDAAFNKALVEELLKQQESSSENADSQPQSGESAEDQQQSQDQQAEQQQQQQQDESEESSSDSDEQTDAQSDLDQASRDEKQEALEAWLRRVPDDPGGLLRRKFQYETNQRLRRGDYRDRQQEKIW